MERSGQKGYTGASNRKCLSGSKSARMLVTYETKGHNLFTFLAELPLRRNAFYLSHVLTHRFPMSVKAFAIQLLNSVKDVRANSETLKCDNLIAYLEEVIAAPPGDPTPSQIEHYKFQLQLMVEREKGNHASSLEEFRSVIQSGQNALKTALLMNGGASIALLAFIGKLTERQQSQIPNFAEALAIFVLGVFSIVVASGSTYLSQWFYAEFGNWARRTGAGFNILSILLALTSYGLFVWGMCKAYSALLAFT